jgi:hypothetical protein
MSRSQRRFVSDVWNSSAREDNNEIKTGHGLRPSPFELAGEREAKITHPHDGLVRMSDYKRLRCHHEALVTKM